ncbi:hypothetical protein INR49_004064 [Caranx melampygus]|nr:hypothetical protein INR49_004064 [Caranx melampygus]
MGVWPGYVVSRLKGKCGVKKRNEEDHLETTMEWTNERRGEERRGEEEKRRAVACSQFEGEGSKLGFLQGQT